MNQQNSNTSEVRGEQAASKKLQTLKLGLDAHADTIVVVRILDHSALQPALKFRPAKFLAWIKTQLPLAGAVHSCYEAGPFGYGLHRELVALGVHNLVKVLNPAAPERTKTKTAFKKKQKRLKRKPALTLLIAVRLPAPRLRQAGGPSDAPTALCIAGTGRLSRCST
jgi:hypothetical protein